MRTTLFVNSGCVEGALVKGASNTLDSAFWDILHSPRLRRFAWQEPSQFRTSVIMQAAVVTLRSRSEVVFGSIMHGNCPSCQVTLGRQNLVAGGKHQKINRKTIEGLNHWEFHLSDTTTFAMSFWCWNLWGFVHREFFEKASVSCETWKMNLELMEPESGRVL